MSRHPEPPTASGPAEPPRTKPAPRPTSPAPRPGGIFNLKGASGLVTAPATPEATTTTPPLPRLLWGWPETVAATGIARRTLERELAAGRFPKPIKRVGRRPYWHPTDVIAWAGGRWPNGG
jgi:predicted DNA-binding transcriptional regulator AlpA